MKIPFKTILTSLTGISTPVFGVSWNPPESEREVVRKLLIFLEDRRVLYNPYDLEVFDQVAHSVLSIRARLTETLESLGEDSEIAPHLRSMRAACRKFLNDTSGRGPRRPYYPVKDDFTALGELRAVFGIQIAQLCVKYGIDIEGDVASILPAADNDSKTLTSG